VCSYPGCHPQRTSQNRINQYCDKTIAPHKINGFRVVQGELIKEVGLYCNSLILKIAQSGEIPDWDEVEL
jgi:hypothetical protein